MKTINEYNDKELRWVHPNKFKGEYELHGGDEVFIRLHPKGSWSTHTVAETANGNLIIKRKGPGQTVTIQVEDSQSELATVKRGMSGASTLVTSDGHEYRWRCTSFWRDIWTWFSNEDTPLLHCIRGSLVKLEPAAHDLPDLALLAVLGWYLHKQHEEEATVAAIVPVIG